jgi:phage tail-like protein
MSFTSALDELNPFAAAKPLPGYHFRVDFGLPGLFVKDVAFRRISGIGFSVKEKEHEVGSAIGGIVYSIENVTFTPLVLERGMFTGSFLINWMEAQCYTKKKIPIPIIITMLDEEGFPVYSWFFINAYPISWETTGFDSEKSELMVEKITFRYLFYKQVNMSVMFEALKLAMKAGRAALSAI